jgi:hypothetical protein
MFVCAFGLAVVAATVAERRGAGPRAVIPVGIGGGGVGVGLLVAAAYLPWYAAGTIFVVLSLVGGLAVRQAAKTIFGDFMGWWRSRRTPLTPTPDET